MSLFKIPSQSVFGKRFAKPLTKEFRKTSNGIFALKHCMYLMLDVVANSSRCNHHL